MIAPATPLPLALFALPITPGFGRETRESVAAPLAANATTSATSTPWMVTLVTKAGMDRGLAERFVSQSLRIVVLCTGTTRLAQRCADPVRLVWAAGASESVKRRTTVAS